MAEEIPTGTGDQLDLQCLPTTVVPKILQLLKDPDDGEKGRMKTILNLREVCNTTRRWIDDDLGENEGRKLFSNSQMHVDLSVGPEATLKQFLECPPPRHITSLRITGASNAGDTPETFRQFTQYWTTNIDDDLENGGHFIDSLELDTYDVDCSALVEFLRSPNLAALQKFRYGRIAGSPESVASVGGGILPSFFSQLQEFQLDSQPDATVLNLVDDFYRNVAESSTLKKVTLLHEENIASLTNLVEQKKEKADFQLEMSLKVTYENIHSFLDAVPSLLRAIGESKSTIRVVELDEFTLRNETLLQSEEKVKKFRQGVQTFSLFLLMSPLLENSDENFPNLRRVVIPDARPFMRFGQLIPFSHSFRSTTVTSLTLIDLNCTDSSLVEMLDSFSTGLPNLSTLEIEWTPSQAPFVYETSEDDESKFRKLTCLDLTVNLGEIGSSISDAAMCVQGILLCGFGLFQLPLRKLAVKVTPDSSPLAQECFEHLFEHGNFLEKMCQRRMCQTLTEFVVSHDVNGDKKELWQKLLESVKKNYAKRARTHGFVRGQLNSPNSSESVHLFRAVWN